MNRGTERTVKVRHRVPGRDLVHPELRIGEKSCKTADRSIIHVLLLERMKKSLLH